MRSILRTVALMAALIAGHLIVSGITPAAAQPEHPCYNKLCQVVNQPNFPSYCYGWPFGLCMGNGKCCVAA